MLFFLSEIFDFFFIIKKEKTGGRLKTDGNETTRVMRVTKADLYSDDYFTVLNCLYSVTIMATNRIVLVGSFARKDDASSF